MNAAEQNAFLTMHIPYKLGAIDLCQEMADLLARSGDQHPTTVTFGSARSFKFKNVRPVTNAFVEHGFMSCRVLLEFLGVGLNKAQTGLSERRSHRPDTVSLRDFGRPVLTVADVEGKLDGDRTLIEGIVHVIRAGHKGGAHLTRGGDSLPIDQLVAGCRATRILVDHYLYRALNHAVPPAKSFLRDE